MRESWLREVTAAVRTELPAAELSDLVPLEGGRSGVTLVGRLRADGAEQEVVVKAAPEGRSPVGRHDVLRQADILDLLASVADVPCPRVLARVRGRDTCFVMQRCPGSVTEPVLDAAEAVLPGELVRERAMRAAEMLAALHRPDLGSALRERGEPVSDLVEEVERWSKTAASVDPTLAPGIGELAESLAASVPAVTGPAVLVHGDYRLGNIVFDGARPTGVIDWEIWGLSRPGIDLGWFLVFCDAAAFPCIGSPVAGLPGAGELVEVYQKAGGPVPEDLRWYEAFGRFKMAAIMAHNLRRHREGRHVDPFQERLPPTIRQLAASGAEMLARR